MNWNDSIIEQFRANDGQVDRFGKHLLLLHTTGAKSGEPRIAPMMYFAEPEGIFVIASKAGAPDHPAWYHNLLVHPEVKVEQATENGVEVFDATAAPVDRELRDTLYARFAERNPGFAGYQENTDRIIPVVQLHRVERSAS
ncbi:nitroreductase family deazaflavin-dependent oxidoreductase [soil metagenome]